MSLNIIYSIKGQLDPSLIDKIATELNEEKHDILLAIRELLPIVVIKIAMHHEKPIIWEFLTNFTLPDPETIIDQRYVNSILLDKVFMDKFSKLICFTSVYIDISNAASKQLLLLIIATVINALRIHIKENNIDAPAVPDLLEQQKNIAMALLPEKKFWNFST